MSATVDTAADVCPFHVDVSTDAIDDLRRRIKATRWPSKQLVDDRSQGVQLATLKALAGYWTTDYDFGRVESRLNALPQFTTEIDGLQIHFIHVTSSHDNALPLLMTHGWPGSVIELRVAAAAGHRRPGVVDVLGPELVPEADRPRDLDDEAKRARIAGKPNWQMYPRQMLVARATAELARQTHPEARCHKSDTACQRGG